MVMVSVTNAIYVLDLEKRFSLFNRRACDIPGRAAAELLGQTYEKLFPADKLDEVTQQYEKVARGGATVVSFETPLQRKDGRIAGYHPRFGPEYATSLSSGSPTLNR